MLVFEKERVILISLNNYMPLENRKRKTYLFLDCFIQTLSKYIPTESKIKNLFEDCLLYMKQVFSHGNLENFSGEYER